jgi:hypothetical protein
MDEVNNQNEQQNLSKEDCDLNNSWNNNERIELLKELITSSQLMIKPFVPDMEMLNAMALVWSKLLRSIPTDKLRSVFGEAVLSREKIYLPITAPEVLKCWMMKQKGFKFFNGEWFDDPATSKIRE